MNLIRGLLCFALITGVACAQAPASEPRPEFEVASVKVSPPTPPQQVDVGIHIDGAQVHMAYAALKDYIRIAYRVKSDQVVGPEWLATERFDVSAKFAEGASRDKLPEMLQALLEDRLGLKIHREQREFSVYALGVANGGVKLKESAASPIAAGAAVNAGGSGSSAGVSVALGRGGSFSLANNRIEARTVTMADFAETLSRFIDREVVDTTGLAATYDLAIDLTPEDYRGMLIQAAVRNGVTLPPEALRLLQGFNNDSLAAGLRSFGLKMDARKMPLEVIVVDQVKHTPTEN